MFLSWGNITVCYILQGLAELFLSPTLWLLCCYAYIPLGFFLIVLLDSLTRTSIDPFKVGIISAASTAVLITSFEPNSIVIIRFANGQIGMAATGNFLISQVLLYLVMGLFCIYYGTKIHLKAPLNLKKHSRLFFWGVITFGFFGPLSIGLGLNVFLPSSDAIFLAIGALLCTISLVLQPKLAYILPFKAYRISVITSDGGLPLFTYNWVTGRAEDDDMLLSGFISAISKGLDAIIQKGNVREVLLDEGILILNKSENYPILFALIATKSTSSLIAGLSCFKQRFVEKYKEYLTDPVYNQTNITNIGPLVSECFPFVPEYR